MLPALQDGIPLTHLTIVPVKTAKEEDLCQKSQIPLAVALQVLTAQKVHPSYK